LLAEFDHLLHQEVEAYETLLGLQQETQHCLAGSALEPLLTNLQAREHLARHISGVEQQRLAVSAQLAPLLQLPVTEMTLHNVSTRVDEPYASRFQQYRAQLRALVQTLQQLNQVQAHLLREVRGFVDGALACVARLLPTQPTYLQSGKLTTSTQGRLLSGRV
jgi:hypothetical protein